MKSTDTQLNDAALLLKAALAAHLSKSGQSLMDLEDAINQNDKGKVASMLKEADPLSLAGGVKDLALGLGQVGLGGAMLYGGMGGLGLYGGYKGLKDSDRKLDEAASVKQRIDLARRELESELAAQHAKQ